MRNWRDVILNKFVPDVGSLTLVSDPDSLLFEDRLVTSLRERGFELIEFNDTIEFRFIFESKYRAMINQQQCPNLILISKLNQIELNSIPFDISQFGKVISIKIGDCFPKLNYRIVKHLDYSLLDTLWEACMAPSQDRLGENLTIEFILSHVFGIVPKLISNEIKLLQMLLTIHYGDKKIPIIFVNRLAELLEGYNLFDKWPLRSILPDSEKFYSFLQERWPLFLKKIHAQNSKEHISNQFLNISGPTDIPFDHPDIRVYIDNLFVEGKLTPINYPNFDTNKERWILSGVSVDKHTSENQRISRLFELVESFQLSKNSIYSDWIKFAINWAELSSLIHTNSKKHKYKCKQEIITIKFNAIFSEWLQTKYRNLISLPPTQPVMLHHIPRNLAREIENQNDARIALIVIDGLSLDQWVTIRKLLKSQNKDFIFKENAVFAWIPTITSVSRQSLFSGKMPFAFPSSILSTNREEHLWQQFWQNEGLNNSEVVYLRGLGDGNPASQIENLISSSRIKVLGLVVSKLDKIIHGMQLGASGMHKNIELWCREKYLVNLLNELIVRDYRVWITSDHGNIECKGQGRLSEGAIAITRGERIRTYPTLELRKKVSDSLDYDTIEWQPVGLPDEFFPLFTCGNDAFANKDEIIVSHGGISIEEVIVPFIEVTRSKNDEQQT